MVWPKELVVVRVPFVMEGFVRSGAARGWRKLGTPKAPEQIKKDIKQHLGKALTPLHTFVVSCSSRRRILDSKSSKKELQTIAKMSKLPLVGFCSFGEIGSRPAETCHYNHLCTNLFNLYNEILPDL